jgi:hypothetical protein
MDPLKKEIKPNEIKIMNCKESSGSNSIDNMEVIVYNDRQMDDFLKLKIFIHPLDILKTGWLNVKIHSLKVNKNK